MATRDAQRWERHAYLKRANPSDQRGALPRMKGVTHMKGIMLDFSADVYATPPFGSNATSYITDNFLPALAIMEKPVVCKKLPSPKRFK